MKKFTSIILSAILLLSLLTGCTGVMDTGDTTNGSNYTTSPTTALTTAPTTAPTTQPTTVPTETTTEPSTPTTHPTKP